MRSLVVLALLMPPLLAAPVAAADVAASEAVAEDPDAFAPLDAAEVDLAAFKWQKRPIVVFADTPEDPLVTRQLALLEARWPELLKRDVVVIVDTDPAAKTAVRQKLRPRGFMMALIGKDGRVALRKPFPWDVRELSRTIDRMGD
jgi:Domain of unknown function (DUF4174)